MRRLFKVILEKRDQQDSFITTGRAAIPRFWGGGNEVQ